MSTTANTANTATAPITATVRCRAFTCEGVRKNLIRIEEDGTVTVWDDVAGSFTVCHALSARTERRIRAKIVVAASED